ncbi:MAG: hypothetical protein KIT09_12000 [Bryobacteraceae bacterium]|nr:hypothetical protein [Bryobacteraceae bacterium]
MSVGPGVAPALPCLTGREGELVSVRIHVEPRLLEELLDALASVSFPVNPQIFHHAAVGYVYPDGREEVVSTTLVEFPAFSSHLPEVREALRSRRLPPELVHVRSMIQNIHGEDDQEPAPAGAPYLTVHLYRHLPEAVLTTTARWPT